METDKLTEALRTESRYKDKSTLEIMDLCMLAADKLEELNDFEQSQGAKLLAKLAEKDKQLSLAEDFIHRVGPDAMEAYRLFSGQQEAGEVSQTRTAPAWAEQFERRFMAGEGGG